MSDITIPLTDEDQENIRNCGAVGFTWEQVADTFDFLTRSIVREQFLNERGQIFELYHEGRLQQELNIRLAVLKSAVNGSTPAQQQMQSYYADADNSIRDLKYQ